MSKVFAVRVCAAGNPTESARANRNAIDARITVLLAARQQSRRAVAILCVVKRRVNRRHYSLRPPLDPGLRTGLRTALGTRLGALLLRLHALRKLGLPSLAIPLLIGLWRNLPRYEQFCEFAAL